MNSRKFSRFFKQITSVIVKCLNGHHKKNHFIGPVILPNRLSDVTYHNFLVNTLPQFLETLAERLYRYGTCMIGFQLILCVI